MKEILIAVIASGLLSTVLTLIYNTIQNSKQKHNSLRDGLQAILYDRLKYLCRSYIKNGAISVDDLEDLKRMHVTYKELNGNGFIDDLMNEVLHLKIVT